MMPKQEQEGDRERLKERDLINNILYERYIIIIFGSYGILSLVEARVMA